MSSGLKGTVKTIIKFPPIILTPIFSIWTIGPIASTKSLCGSSCCNSPQKLGVSICLTWINLFLTLASGFIYVIWHDEGSWENGPETINMIFYICCCPCLVFAMICLILLQCLDKCPGCCCPCIPCCERNCYPVTQFTYLDVNNMDVVITQEEIELDQL